MQYPEKKILSKINTGTCYYKFIRHFYCNIAPSVYSTCQINFCKDEKYEFIFLLVKRKGSGPGRGRKRKNSADFLKDLKNKILLNT